ncbi:MAG TPA: expansin EXLX1 family cellulose-binding protein [Chitinivibrionales bacterium]|nr:expansin EXLX1 family cellulose-binding protein [Chitinivibrionales bacterium]
MNVEVFAKYCPLSIIIMIGFSSLSAQPDSGNIIHAGQATYYAATGDGNCMFGPSPNDLMVVAMNNTEYDSASVCGASIHVKGRLGEVTVRIVDRCPECPKGNIDMSPQAFAKIDDTILGRVPVTWWYVETQVTGPIQYRVKTGSNAWWIGIQILNHRTPVVKVEALYNGAWANVPRTDYNYFVDTSGLGPGPFTLRVTDFYGQQLVDTNIPLSPDAITNGLANFSSHSAVIAMSSGMKINKKDRAFISMNLGGGFEKFQAADVFDVFAVDGSFVHRTNVDGMKTLRAGKNTASGVFIVRPVDFVKY